MVGVMRPGTVTSDSQLQMSPSMGSKSELVSLQALVSDELLITQLADRSTFIRIQVKCIGEGGKLGTVKVPARPCRWWVECFIASQASLRATDDPTMIQYLKAAVLFQDAVLVTTLSGMLGHRLLDMACSEQPSSVKTQYVTQVLDSLSVEIAAMVLREAPGTFLRNFIHLPQSLKPVAVLAQYPALESICMPRMQTSHHSQRQSPSAASVSLCVDVGQDYAADPDMHADGHISSMHDAAQSAVWLHEAGRDGGACMSDNCVFTLEKRTGAVGCRLPLGGTFLQDSTIELPDNACVVFQNACMHLKNVTFQGGAVVCMGSTCQMTFEDCTFEKSGLMVLDAAQATLSGPQFHDMDIAMQGLSILSHGFGTEVIIRGGGFISGGVQGVLVQAGARLEASDLNIHRVCHTGVEVSDEESHVSLSGCAVTSSGHAAVCVHGGATSSLRNCTLSGVKHSAGLLVSDPGSHADVAHCRFTRNFLSAVTVSDHGRVKAVSCISVGNGVASQEPHSGGYAVTDGGVMELTHCSSEGDSCGCRSSHHGHLLCDTVKVSRSANNGFVVEQGGQAMLRECSSSECGGSGMHVVDEGSELDGEGCVVSKNSAYGLYACDAVEVTLTGCCSSGNQKEGYRADCGAQLEMTASASRGDGGAECASTAGGRISMDGRPVGGDCFRSHPLPEPFSQPVASRVAVRKSLHLADARPCGFL